MKENNNKIKIKLTTIIVLILVVIIIIIGITFVISNKYNDKVIDEDSDSLMNYDSGSSNSNDENITYDNGKSFLNNEVLIYFNRNTTESRIEEIINEINGKIISSIGSSKYGHFEVQVDEKFTTYSSIEQYCIMLEEKYDEIELVSINEISYIDY